MGTSESRTLVSPSSVAVRRLNVSHAERRSRSQLIRGANNVFIDIGLPEQLRQFRRFRPSVSAGDKSVHNVRQWLLEGYRFCRNIAAFFVASTQVDRRRQTGQPQNLTGRCMLEAPLLRMPQEKERVAACFK